MEIFNGEVFKEGNIEEWIGKIVDEALHKAKLLSESDSTDFTCIRSDVGSLNDIVNCKNINIMDICEPRDLISSFNIRIKHNMPFDLFINGDLLHSGFTILIKPSTIYLKVKGLWGNQLKYKEMQEKNIFSELIYTNAYIESYIESQISTFLEGKNENATKSENGSSELNIIIGSFTNLVHVLDKLGLGVITKDMRDEDWKVTVIIGPIDGIFTREYTREYTRKLIVSGTYKVSGYSLSLHEPSVLI